MLVAIHINGWRTETKKGLLLLCFFFVPYALVCTFMYVNVICLYALLWRQASVSEVQRVT